MMTSVLYHTQGIRSCKHIAMEYKGGACYEKIECKEFRCPECGSAEVKAYPVRERVIQGQNIGSKRLYLKMLSASLCNGANLTVSIGGPNDTNF